MTAYARLFVAGFRRQSAYLAAAMGGLVANVTFGFLKAAILVATVQAAGGELKGYDAGAMLAYVWLGQAMLGLFNLSGRDVLADRIKNGDVVVDFLRPLSIQGAGWATYMGERLFTLLPRTVPTLALGALTTGFALAPGTAPYLLGALSVLLGMSLSYLCVYLVAMTGLWLVETRGIQVAYMVLSGFLSGLYVPVALFPGWLHTLAYATPGPSILMTPLDILIGRLEGGRAVEMLGVQIAWVLGIALIGVLVTRAGRRRLEVQGG